MRFLGLDDELLFEHRAQSRDVFARGAWDLSRWSIHGGAWAPAAKHTAPRGHLWTLADVDLLQAPVQTQAWTGSE